MIQIVNMLKKWVAGPVGTKTIKYLWMLPTAGLVWVLISYSSQTMGLENRVKKSIEEFSAMEKNLASALSTPSAAQTALNRKNMFSQPTQASMPQCTAILGENALIGNAWYKAGDEVNGAKIVAVEPSLVRILWQEREVNLVPFEVATQYTQANQNQRTGSTQASIQDGSFMGGGRGGMRGGGMRGGMMGGGMMGGMMGDVGEMAGTFFSMPQEERDQLRQRFMNMSEMSNEERRSAFEELRNSFRSRSNNN